MKLKPIGGVVWDMEYFNTLGGSTCAFYNK